MSATRKGRFVMDDQRQYRANVTTRHGMADPQWATEAVLESHESQGCGYRSATVRMQIDIEAGLRLAGSSMRVACSFIFREGGIRRCVTGFKLSNGGLTNASTR